MLEFAMRWSKVKSLVEKRFAPSLKKRLSINSTRYGNCTCGRAWLTLDGEEIANFCTRAHDNKNLEQLTASKKSIAKFEKMPVEYGELSRQDAYRACWAFLHELSLEQALNDEDPLVQTLAIIDSRLGKRRLREVDSRALHPLALKLWKIRMEAEGLSLSLRLASIPD
jgi:hypothetical protein